MSVKPGKPSATTAPMIKGSSTAPIVYFDNVPVMGTFSGNIEVELSARALMPKPDGSVIAEMNCTAHLRCSPVAAAMLMDALQKSLAMLERQQKDMIREASETTRPAPKAAPQLNS